MLYRFHWPSGTRALDALIVPVLEPLYEIRHVQGAGRGFRFEARSVIAAEMPACVVAAHLAREPLPTKTSQQVAALRGSADAGPGFTSGPTAARQMSRCCAQYQQPVKASPPDCVAVVGPPYRTANGHGPLALGCTRPTPIAESMN